MSLNFGQFPVAVNVAATDKIVGYQIINGVPTLAQYTLAQLAGVAPVITPAQFGALMTAWFATLPTTLPSTPNTWWNDGNTLATT
jgi:hypothetical protein